MVGIETKTLPLYKWPNSCLRCSSSWCSRYVNKKNKNVKREMRVCRKKKEGGRKSGKKKLQKIFSKKKKARREIKRGLGGWGCVCVQIIRFRFVFILNNYFHLRDARLTIFKIKKIIFFNLR